MFLRKRLNVVDCGVFAIVLASIIGCFGVEQNENPVDPACQEGPISCSLSNKETLFQYDKCEAKLRVVKECDFGQKCTEQGANQDAVCTCADAVPSRCMYDGPANLYDASIVQGGVTCNQGGATQEPNQTCGFGVMCYADEQGKRHGGKPTCTTSIDPMHKDKPYYAHGCSNGDFLRYPTKLPIDCRCRNVGSGQGTAGGTAGIVDPANIDINNGGFPAGSILNCTRASSQFGNKWPVKYGEGPRMINYYKEAPTSLRWTTGVLHPTKREFFNLVKWTDPDDGEEDGAIVAFDLDTGNRRMVTGKYYDDNGEKVMTGSGYLSQHPRRTNEKTPLRQATVVRWSKKDNMLYTASENEIVRVDPDSGERTLVWMRQDAGASGTGDISATYGQCYRNARASETLKQGVQLIVGGHSFEVGPTGAFYLGFRGIREGSGIIEVSPDGSSCRFVSRSGATAAEAGAPIPDDIGTGKEFKGLPKGLLHHDGKLFYVMTGDLYSLNTTTGDRSRISGDEGFNGIGDGTMFWDDKRKVIWASGNSRTEGSVIDPATGQKESIFGDTGRQDYTRPNAILDSVYGAHRSAYGLFRSGQNLAYGGLALDPDNPDLIYGVLSTGGLFVMERSTFNNMIISW